MKTHQQIDERSLAMVRAIVAKIDADPERKGFAHAREVSRRWYRQRPTPANKEWLELIRRPWEEVRIVLLDESDEGKRLRQNDPFCGILTPHERWDIYNDYGDKARRDAA
jgi:hypothetical protein